MTNIKNTYFIVIPRSSFFEQAVVVEEDSNVVEDFVEFAGRRVKNKVGRDPNLKMKCQN